MTPPAANYLITERPSGRDRDSSGSRLGAARSAAIGLGWASPPSSRATYARTATSPRPPSEASATNATARRRAPRSPCGLLTPDLWFMSTASGLKRKTPNGVLEHMDANPSKPTDAHGQAAPRGTAGVMVFGTLVAAAGGYLLAVYQPMGWVGIFLGASAVVLAFKNRGWLALALALAGAGACFVGLLEWVSGWN
jgi:hypothetical protein